MRPEEHLKLAKKLGLPGTEPRPIVMCRGDLISWLVISGFAVIPTAQVEASLEAEVACANRHYPYTSSPLYWKWFPLTKHDSKIIFRDFGNQCNYELPFAGCSKSDFGGEPKKYVYQQPVPLEALKIVEKVRDALGELVVFVVGATSDVRLDPFLGVAYRSDKARERIPVVIACWQEPGF